MDYLIIPIKTFKNSKNRLKPNLIDEARIEFCKFMAIDVLKEAIKCNHFDKIIIISKEDRVFDDFNSEKIILIKDNEEKGINQAIQLAIKSLNINNKDSILILHADIPLITRNDLNFITEKANSSQKIAILVPSKRKDGTNALLLKPPDLITLQFGKNSYEKHLKSLEKIPDLKILSLENENISLDIDTYEDIVDFFNRNSKTLSQKFLIEKKIVN